MGVAAGRVSTASSSEFTVARRPSSNSMKTSILGPVKAEFRTYVMGPSSSVTESRPPRAQPLANNATARIANGFLMMMPLTVMRTGVRRRKARQPLTLRVSEGSNPGAEQHLPLTGAGDSSGAASNRSAISAPSTRAHDCRPFVADVLQRRRPNPRLPRRHGAAARTAAPWRPARWERPGGTSWRAPPVLFLPRQAGGARCRRGAGEAPAGAPARLHRKSGGCAGRKSPTSDCLRRHCRFAPKAPNKSPLVNTPPASPWSGPKKWPSITLPAMSA